MGAVLIAAYAVFAVSATARAVFQLATKFDEAPVPYLLSALAAVVYILATVSLARSGPFWERVAFASVTFELLGVITVGALSFLLPDVFQVNSVWSRLGQGYGFVPLVLPILGLAWLRSRSATT